MTEVEILRARVELLREAHQMANEALRSAWSIAERDGRETNWAGHRAQLRASLDASHAAMAAIMSAPRPSPFFECPGCGKDIADSNTKHDPDCPRK